VLGPGTSCRSTPKGGSHAETLIDQGSDVLRVSVLDDHCDISGSAAAILTAYFGDDMPVEAFSEGLPGVTLTWPNFAAAGHDVMMARVWGGIHFLFTMTDTRDRAARIGLYVLEQAAQPQNGERVGQLDK